MLPSAVVVATLAILVMVDAECYTTSPKVGHYPCVVEFLSDYVRHYKYIEIHFVLYKKDRDVMQSIGMSLLRKKLPATVALFSQLSDISRSQSNLKEEWESQYLPESFPRVPIAKMPIFVTTLDTVKELWNDHNAIQQWSASKSFRNAAWLLITKNLSEVSTSEQYFPLDNQVNADTFNYNSVSVDNVLRFIYGGQKVSQLQVMFVKWIRNNPTGKTYIELLEVYQAAPHLRQISSRVGFWLESSRSLYSDEYSSNLGPSLNKTPVPLFQKKKPVPYSFPDGNMASRRNNLTGLHLRCVTMSWEPFTHNKPTTENEFSIGGFMGGSLDIIREKLNFTYSCRQPPDKQYGAKVNGSWTGLVGQLVQDKGDLVVAALDNTYERTQAIDFCMPSGLTEYGLVIRRPEPENWTNYSRIFDWRTWLAYLCYIVTSCLLYHIFVVIQGVNEQWRFGDSAFDIFSLHTNQGSNTVCGLPRRIYVFVVILTSWMTLTFYTSNLISSLTIPILNPPFDTLAGVLDFESYDLGLQKGNSEVERFRISEDPILRQIWLKNVMRNPNNLVNTLEEAFHRLMVDKFVFFMEMGLYSHIYSNNCSFIVLEEGFMKFGSGMAVQKESPLRAILNYHIFQQQVAGVSDRLLREFTPPKKPCVPPTSESLGILPLIVAFLILITGIILSMITLLFEAIVSPKKGGTRMQCWS